MFVCTNKGGWTYMHFDAVGVSGVSELSLAETGMFYVNINILNSVQVLLFQNKITFSDRDLTRINLPMLWISFSVPHLIR